MNLEITKVWEKIDETQDCISLTSSVDFRENLQHYTMNKKIRALYLELKHVIINNLQVNTTYDRNIELVKQLKVIVEFEHSLNLSSVILYKKLNDQIYSKIKQINQLLALLCIVLICGGIVLQYYNISRTGMYYTSILCFCVTLYYN